MSDLTKDQVELFSAEQIKLHEYMKRVDGNVAPVNAVNAAVNLTLGAQATAGDTVTIGNKVFTFVASGADANGEVNIGADKAATQVNMKAAINGTDGYNIAHTQVICGTLAGDVYPITAIIAGAVGNSILVAETFFSVSNLFSHDHLAAGVDGTLAVAGEQRADATYLYVASADNTTADKNWRRVALGSAF